MNESLFEEEEEEEEQGRGSKTEANHFSKKRSEAGRRERESVRESSVIVRNENKGKRRVQPPTALFPRFLTTSRTISTRTITQRRSPPRKKKYQKKKNKAEKAAAEKEEATKTKVNISAVVGTDAKATDVIVCSTTGRERVIGCFECGITQTPQWRQGQHGPKTLCNRCGVAYRKRQLLNSSALF